MERKYRNLVIIGLIGIMLALISATYAYWMITKTQTNSNIITSKCLNISISGETNDINLVDAYPITDEDGEATVPYTFTITNNCNSAVDYQVVLESIGNASEALHPSSIKVKINDYNPRTLNKYPIMSSNIEGAYESHKLTSGTLAALGEEGSSKIYELRLWIDENTTIEENGKSYEGKISVSIGEIQTDTMRYYSMATGQLDAGLPSDADPNISNINTHGYPFYLAFDSQDSLSINNSYVCFIKNEIEYCLKAKDNYAYENNRSLLNDAFLNGDSCVDGSNSYMCQGNEFLVILYHSTGRIDVQKNNNERCYVYSSGSYGCIGW